jgi:hypothetical protein
MRSTQNDGITPANRNQAEFFNSILDFRTVRLPLAPASPRILPRMLRIKPAVQLASRRNLQFDPVEF